MRYRAAARRAELQFSARAFLACAIGAAILAAWGYWQLHDNTITGFHLAVTGYLARQAHRDHTLAHTIGDH